MYKAVIFDLDGTLFDTLPDIREVLNKTLAHFSLPTLSRERVAAFIGNGARELVRLSIGEENADRLEEILRFYKAEYAKNDGALSKFFDGEEEALLMLKSRGVRMAVLTNKPHNVALKTNENYFAPFCFDCVLGQREGLPLKPAPDGAYEILKSLGVKKEECLFVGDGETDVQTAKNAGLCCVSVLWGYRTKDALEAAGATRFASSFKELAGIILQQN